MGAGGGELPEADKILHVHNKFITGQMGVEDAAILSPASAGRIADTKMPGHMPWPVYESSGILGGMARSVSPCSGNQHRASVISDCPEYTIVLGETQ